MAHITSNIGGIREMDKGRTNDDNSLDADDTDNADLKGCAINVDKKKIRVIRVIRV